MEITDRTATATTSRGFRHTFELPVDVLIEDLEWQVHGDVLELRGLSTDKPRREHDRPGASAPGRQASVAAAARPQVRSSHLRLGRHGRSRLERGRERTAGTRGRTLASGLDLVVVTGTHVGNVDEQLCARPTGPGRLYFCVNRGSEVYVAKEHGVEHHRAAQGDPRTKRQMLDAAAVAHGRRQLGRRGSGSAQVVAERLNRRKIDLIPEPEWADPPKAPISELLAAVQGPTSSRRAWPASGGGRARGRRVHTRLG